MLLYLRMLGLGFRVWVCFLLLYMGPADALLRRMPACKAYLGSGKAE